MREKRIVLLGICAVVAATVGHAEVHHSTIVFDGGSDGYHSYRIPSLVSTNEDTLLAFAEGRVDGIADFGNVDLVFKRSTDHGETWSALGTVVSAGAGTWGNPTAVVDRATGRIWLFMSWNDEDHNQQGIQGYLPIDEWGQRRVFASHSDDDGLTWSDPVDLTEDLKPADFDGDRAWDAMGPGVGIQTRFANPGRLVVPAFGRNIFSDDGGQTWSWARVRPEGEDRLTSESTVVELADGALMRNDRAILSEWNQGKRRRVATGSIEEGFPPFAPDEKLIDPRCQGSILRYTDPPSSRILFLNPATELPRCNMTVRVSCDEGVTWPIRRRVHGWLASASLPEEDESCFCPPEQCCQPEGICDAPTVQRKGGYSSMARTADLEVGALIEVLEDVYGGADAHLSIEFHRFDMSWILNGQLETDATEICDGLDNDCDGARDEDFPDLDQDGVGDACDDDRDGDSVLNSSDQCSDTALGDLVNPAHGCTIDQLCPCEGPRETSESWDTHGQYVRCVMRGAIEFRRAGLITPAEAFGIIFGALRSDCGS